MASQNVCVKDVNDSLLVRVYKPLNVIRQYKDSGLQLHDYEHDKDPIRQVALIFTTEVAIWVICNGICVHSQFMWVDLRYLPDI